MWRIEGVWLPWIFDEAAVVLSLWRSRRMERRSWHSLIAFGVARELENRRHRTQDARGVLLGHKLSQLDAYSLRKV